EMDADAWRTYEEVFHRTHMSGGKIADMYIVAHRGPVVGVVIGTEYLDCRVYALRSGDHQRDQVSLRRMIFAELAIGIGARRVEISQTDVTHPVGSFVPVEDLLHEQLGCSVRIDRRLWVIFGDRQGLRHAQGRTG